MIVVKQNARAAMVLKKLDAPVIQKDEFIKMTFKTNKTCWKCKLEN